MSDQLTPQEASLALNIISQSGASLKFDINDPDEAILTATLYKSLSQKLRAMANQQTQIDGNEPLPEVKAK